MTLQARNFSLCLLALAVSIFALTGCEKKNDPFHKKGNTPDPHWTVETAQTMPISMTVTVRVEFANSEGSLAAFIDDTCCGVAEYVNGLYYLYITPLTEDGGGEVKLRFYSPDLKRIFKAKETFPFINNEQIGTPNDPYTPEWTVDK